MRRTVCCDEKEDDIFHEAKVQLFSIDVSTIEVIAICIFSADSLVFAAGRGARICPQREET